jgi:hypothetical protein
MQNPFAWFWLLIPLNLSCAAFVGNHLFSTNGISARNERCGRGVLATCMLSSRSFTHRSARKTCVEIRLSGGKLPFDDDGEPDVFDVRNLPKDSMRKPENLPDDTWKTLPRVYVLLFNPRSDNEGICECALIMRTVCNNII